MFFWRKTDPVDRSNALIILGKWTRDSDAVDNATDAMREVAAEDPNGILSDSFEDKRSATVKLVSRLLKENKDQGNWPQMVDDKGQALISVLKNVFNETLAQQLDSLRLQREYAKAQKLNKLSDADVDVLATVHARMDNLMDEMGRAAVKLARHYRVTTQEYARAERSSD